MYNDADEVVTIDGAGLITLSGSGNHRILHMDTCDEGLKWTTSHCNDQDHPRLTVQNLTFVDGNSTGWPDEGNRGGGGAIYAYGGRFKAVNTRFFNNVCDEDGPDVGGAAIRVMAQSEGLPAYVVNSTFGGSPELGNRCSNGGGISSIDVSWTIVNSYFAYNVATGEGANPPTAGTPGGGSGGGIYNDGNSITLALCGTLIEHNEVNAHGAAIFFIANDMKGTLILEETTIQDNCGGSWYELPGISMHPTTDVSQEGTTLEGCSE